MSDKPPGRGAPPPGPHPEEDVGPLRFVVQSEAQRVLSDAAVAPDPVRVANGWQRRFIADRARAAEMVEFYRALGYEAEADPVRAAEVGENCDDCELVAAQRLVTIYTRRAGAPTGADGGKEPMDEPIDQLLEEHKQIMAEIESLRVAVERLRQDGEAAVPAALPALRSVGRMMATRLLQHARKEDEALFPALEEMFGAEGTPTAVMREEHREIHDRARRFRETLSELEAEHPAIVAGTESLRDLVQRGGSAKALQEVGDDIIRRLDLHFAKEEQILFPMARETLSGRALADVARRMAAIDAGVEP